MIPVGAVLLFGTFYSFVRSSLSYIFPLVSSSHWYVIPVGTVLLSCYFVHSSPCYSMFFSLVYSSSWYVLPMCMLFHLVCSPYVYVLPFICLSIDIFSFDMFFLILWSSTWFFLPLDVFSFGYFLLICSCSWLFFPHDTFCPFVWSSAWYDHFTFWLLVGYKRLTCWIKKK